MSASAELLVRHGSVGSRPKPARTEGMHWAGLHAEVTNVALPGTTMTDRGPRSLRLNTMWEVLQNVDVTMASSKPLKVGNSCLVF